MITLCLGAAVAMSDHESWTATRKSIAIIQMVLIDIGMIALCCW